MIKGVIDLGFSVYKEAYSRRISLRWFVGTVPVALRRSLKVSTLALGTHEHTYDRNIWQLQQLLQQC